MSLNFENLKMKTCMDKCSQNLENGQTSTVTAATLTSGLLAKLDYFGYPIGFSFNRSSNVHNTWFGGFVSLFIRIFIMVYAVNMLQTYQYSSPTMA